MTDLMPASAALRSQVTAQAKIEFEAAATHWLVETLNVVKALAPQCHWGYFGSPSICSPYGPCESDPATVRL